MQHSEIGGGKYELGLSSVPADSMAFKREPVLSPLNVRIGVARLLLTRAMLGLPLRCCGGDAS